MKLRENDAVPTITLSASYGKEYGYEYGAADYFITNAHCKGAARTKAAGTA